MPRHQVFGLVAAKKEGSATVFVCSADQANFRVEVIARSEFEALQSLGVNTAYEKAIRESVNVAS